MKWSVHAAVGAVLGILLCKVLNAPSSFIIFSILFSLVPDIDATYSYILYRFPLLSKILRYTIYYPSILISTTVSERRVSRHRGIMHTIFPLVPLTILFIPFAILLGRSVLLFMYAGYLSHLALDAMTFLGVAPLSPLVDVRIRSRRTRALSEVEEKAILLAFLFLTIALSYLSYTLALLLPLPILLCLCCKVEYPGKAGRVSKGRYLRFS